MAVKTSWTAGEVLTAADLTDTFGAKAPKASPTFSGSATMTDSGSFQPQLYVKNTNTDAYSGYIIMEKLPTDNAMSANDYMGVVKFNGIDSGGTARQGCAFEARAASQGASYVEGYLSILTTNSAGVSAEKMRIDGSGLITGSGSSLGAWTSWTPTLGGTGVAVGNGTFTSGWSQIGKTIIYRMTFTVGSTTTFGSGGLTFTLPVAPVDVAFGTGTFYDVSTGAVVGAIATTVSSTTMLVRTTDANPGVQATTNAPWTWATGDTIFITGRYERS